MKVTQLGAAEQAQDHPTPPPPVGHPVSTMSEGAEDDGWLSELRRRAGEQEARQPRRCAQRPSLPLPVCL